MNAPLTRKGPQALDIKSATIYTVRLVLHSADTAELLEALQLRMQDAGAFFQNEPVVIDSSALHEPIDWPPLIEALRQYQLHPIGMMGQPDHEISAAEHNLPTVELSTTKTVIEIPEPTTEPDPIETRVAPMIVRHPLRSGQRLFAPDGDVIIAGMVGQGAEVIAKGSIYVHGPLRGKAIAGANGDSNTFIIAAEFEPELIAIAGVYSVIEDLNASPYYKQGVIIQLDGESLTYEPLG